VKTTLADDLGIDPGPTVYSLYERILRQERLDVKQAAKTTAADTLVAMGQRTGVGTRSTVARLRDGSGHSFPLLVAVTRIGRLADNDIVLDDAKVSRHHAVVIDTGAGLAISDLRSANGVEVAGERIRGSATLADGDRIRIGHHEFTFEIEARDS
jgi:SARP family transcriptional regulator, regulator of embCAB operon